MTEDKTVKGILHGVPVTVTIKGKPDYTPTTEEVRQQYVFTASVIDGTSFVDPTQGEAEFDRWLAEVKAQAVAEWRAERDAKFNKLTVDTLRQGEEQ